MPCFLKSFNFPASFEIMEIFTLLYSISKCMLKCTHFGVAFQDVSYLNYKHKIHLKKKKISEILTCFQQEK